MTAALSRNVAMLVLALLCARGFAAMRPQVVDTQYPTADVVVASLVVKAPGDGQADAAPAIQAAIDQAAGAGGAVIFLPPGRYRLGRPLVLKEGVTLRGDWAPPTPGKPLPDRGTLLLPTADKGNADGPPAITMERGSGIREVTIWYPDQDPEHIVPYPWTLRTCQKAVGNNTTVWNVTLVNPYQAIRIGPEWNELHTIRNVFGTPLHTGLWIDTTTDIGRLVDVDFRPAWWEASGLPGAPATQEARKALRDALRRDAVAVEMRRSDWEYVYRVRVAGYAVGFTMRAGEKGTANAVMYGCRAEDCGTALRLERLNPVGLSVTESHFAADGPAVEAPGSFASVGQFNGCTLASRSGPAARLDGSGTLAFQGCTFAGMAEARRGTLTVLGCTFQREGTHVRLGKAVRRARVLGNRFAGPPGIENASSGDVAVAHADLGFARPKLWPHAEPPEPRPATAKLFVVSDFAAAPAAPDNTAAFAKALDAARKAGGGTVYVPAGCYRFAGNLVVPSGVELRGIFDVPHHTVSGGSVLMPTAGKGSADAQPFISLEAKAGLRGLTFWYPEQDLRKISPYPWAIRSLGAGCWLVDVTLGNAYQGADFWTHPSDGHLIRYLAGAFLKRGLFVSKADGNGWVEDVQFNPHYSARLHASLPRLPITPPNFQAVVGYQRANLEGIVFGRCRREHVRRTFLYAAYDGIAFRDDAGGANAQVIAHGTDTGSRGAVLEAAGPEGVTFLNAQLVPLGAHEKGAIIASDSFAGRAAFFGTQIWAGNTSGVIAGKGEVVVQGLNTVSGPFTLAGGRVTIENAHFQRGLQPHIRVAAGCAHARLLANFARNELRIHNAAGEHLYARANSLGAPGAAGRLTLSTGFEEGQPQGVADAVATRGGGLRKVSKATCRPAATEAHSGKRALRVAGVADDPAYSYVYFTLFEEPIGVAADSVVTYWIRPANERGRCVGLDALFTDGSTLRDSGARTAGNQGVHPGNPKGAVGRWSKIAIPLGRTHAGKVIAAILVGYDSRTGGGPFEAWLDDLAIESARAGLPRPVAAKPKGGAFTGSVSVELISPDGAPVRYALDGLSPGADSPLYGKPIVLDRPGLWELRFAPQAPDGRLGPVGAALFDIAEEHP